MPKTSKQKVVPIIFDTYLMVIKNSVGSKMFRNYYAKVNGKKVDIMRNGDLSCAFFVSSNLVIFKYIKSIHGTVDATVNDLLESGWLEIKKPKVGCVLVWEGVASNGGEVHKHIGFYIGRDMAISNSDKLKYPVEHSWNFKGKRKLEKIMWNPIFK